MTSLARGVRPSDRHPGTPSCSYAPHRPVRTRPCLALCLARPSLPSRTEGRTWDVFGLGQAMVDFSGVVDDAFLDHKALAKGGRRVISVAERAALIEELSGDGFTLNAGGSLANTLAGCAVLGSAPSSQPPLRVGLGGCVGDDHLGSFFRTQLDKAGVDWITAAAPGTGTGTVIVLTTEDAQRSFLSYPGTSDAIAICAATEDAIRSSRVLVIEGYLWEMPGAGTSIMRAIEIAHEAGTVVALTMADASVVLRHRDAMLAALRCADLLFTNAAEAAALLGADAPAQDAALQLGCLCPVAVVTDGSKGSYITALGQLHVIPPHWALHGPVDTCGAGDAYAAGVLYGYLSGFDVRQMGEFAAHTAAQVISHHGPELTHAHAKVLVAAHTRQPISL